MSVGDFMEAAENAASLGNLDANDLLHVTDASASAGPCQGALPDVFGVQAGGLGGIWPGALIEGFKARVTGPLRGHTADPVAYQMPLKSSQGAGRK